MPKPTIVFIPGAFHTPALFEPVLPFLHAADYPTTLIHLPGVGCSPGVPNLSKDVEAIRVVVGGLAELGREVLIVAHSLGGVYATEALQGLSKKEREAAGHDGGVIALLFIAAQLPKLGELPIDSLKPCSPEEEASPTLLKTTLDEDDPTTCFAENTVEALYHDLDPAVAKYYSSLLRSQSSGPLFTPITYESYRHIPSAYLLLLNDQAMPMPTQKRMAERAGIQRLLGPLNSGHSPFISHPEEVLKFIREVAEPTQS